MDARYQDLKKFLHQLQRVSPGELREPLDSTSANSNGAMPEPLLLKYSSLVFHRTQEIRFPVPDNIFEQHIRDTKDAMEDDGDPALRNELVRHEIDKQPSLNFLQAIGALDSLILAGDHERQEKLSARYCNIDNALERVAYAVWHNEDIHTAARELSKLLYHEDESINATRSKRSADELARQLASLARDVKNEMLGIVR